jgi:hypothetical protein
MMPRVPDQLLRSVVFLYLNEDSARKGEGAGGTGFFIHVRSKHSGQGVQYGVTNDHIAGASTGGRNLVIRGNTRDGFDVLTIPREAWIGHPDSDDVALAPVEIPDHWSTTAIDWAALCPTPARFTELNVGIGDDVVMIGRFIGHEGRESNQPIARFGNIALMPGERVQDGRGLRVEAYLTEMRSLPGFSGSPVFVYIGPGSYRGNERMMPFYSETIGIIGVDTGHKQTASAIYNTATNQRIAEPWEVRQNSGIAIVAPYWKITDILNMEQGDEQRGAVTLE